MPRGHWLAACLLDQEGRARREADTVQPAAVPRLSSAALAASALTAWKLGSGQLRCQLRGEERGLSVDQT